MLICLKTAGCVANSVDPGNMLLPGVWSKSTMVAQACLSKDLQ